MRKIYTILGLLLVVALLAGGISCGEGAAPAGEPTQIRFLSASVGTQNFGGQSYWMGELQKKLQIPCGAFPGGPEFNLPIIGRGEAEFTYTNPKFANLAYNGAAPFETKMENLRWTSSFMAVATACIVRNDSDIQSITGATISSRAVAKSIVAAYEKFKSEKESN